MTHKACICKIFVIILTLSIYSGISLAGPIEDLQPGHWYEVPNSNLASVLPNPLPPGYNSPRGIMDAWNSGAYDTSRDRLIVWGGGHGDYGGNEIYVFDIGTLSWSRVWGPSLDIPPAGGLVCYETFSDGNPSSRHTYDGIEYVPNTDSLFSQGGSRWCGSGGGTHATWTYSFNNSQWQQRTDEPHTGMEMLGILTAYDPVTGHIFHQSLNKFSEYNPVNDTWTVRGNEPDGGWWQDRMTGAIDPEKRLFVAVGQGYVRMWNLSTMSYSEVSTSGGDSIVNASAPGFEYDPVSKKFVAWNGGSDVYTLDTDTLTWSMHTPAATNTTTPTQPAYAGTFGRFRYIPSKNAFIVVNDVYENVYIYKLSLGSGSPPPSDSTPPSVSITSPTSGSTVSNTIPVSANAIDNVAIAGVQFKINGANIGVEDTSAPYSVNWDTTQYSNGAYTLSAVARDPSGNTAIAGGIPVTVSNVSQPPGNNDNRINIPLRTWIKRDLPGDGKGPWGRIKHLRLTFNPIDKLIYVLGGDYNGPIGLASGRNEIYTYSVADDVWTLEHPYCAPSGSVQPSHPDEVGWVYDTRRNIFWMIPGYMGPDQGHCQSSVIKGEIMTYDPSAHEWTFPQRTEDSMPASSAYNKFAQYDPVTDTIIRFYGYNSSPKVLIYHINDDSWEVNTYGNLTASLGEEYSALDLENRVIYIIDGVTGKLYKYHIDAKTLTHISDAPVITGRTDVTMPIWDSVNKVLLWPQIFDFTGVGMKLHAYHPDTDTWEANLPINQPEGLEVRGNSAVFDPNQNVLILLGGSLDADINTHVFLYRYGNGSGTPPADVISPSSPTNLRLN